MNVLTGPRKKLPPCLLREMNTLWIQANSRKQKRGCWKTLAMRWSFVAGRRPVMDLCCDGAPWMCHHSRTALKTEEAHVTQPPSLWADDVQRLSLALACLHRLFAPQVAFQLRFPAGIRSMRDPTPRARGECFLPPLDKPPPHRCHPP